ncbi:MAG: DsrE family protein [Phycisphaerae bacterium]|nr:DsrE family protein [Phycisphaerae bacterium]
MAAIIVLNRAQMGNGDTDLGRKLLGACLRKLPAAFSDLQAVVLFNDGVKLATRDSFVAQDLMQLDEQGVDIIVCGTCLKHYGLTDQFIFPQPSGMDDILAALNKADKVITL